MSAEDYPPIPGPGARQIAWAVLVGEVVAKEKWNSLTYSEAFMERYGVPINHWSHWHKLTSFPRRERFFPKFRHTFYELPRDMTFVRFAHIIDTKYVQLGHTVPGRLEMEALYAQFLLKKFDESPTTDNAKKVILRKLLVERVGEKAEKYWLRKQAKFSLSDQYIARLNEEADEPENESNIDFEHDQSIDNEYGGNVEGAIGAREDNEAKDSEKAEMDGSKDDGTDGSGDVEMIGSGLPFRPKSAGH